MGDNGILTQATESKIINQKSSEKEKIQLALTDAVIDYENSINKGIIQEKVEKNIKEKDVEVSDRRPGDEYEYIVKIEDNIYGIKSDNTVEIIEACIRNQYIEIVEVTEETPKYVFKNTITQEDINKETNKNDSVYTIVGVSNEEEGEYITEDIIEGKSGYLSIVDLQNAEL